jgi:hypothetical protein
MPKETDRPTENIELSNNPTIHLEQVPSTSRQPPQNPKQVEENMNAQVHCGTHQPKKNSATAKKQKEKMQKNDEPEYEKSEYELYVEEKRRHNAEHMKQWDLKALQAQKENNNTKKNTPCLVACTAIDKPSKVTPLRDSSNISNNISAGDNTRRTVDRTADNKPSKDATVEKVSNIDVSGTTTSPKSGNTTDYRDETNWTVDFFVSHKEKIFLITNNRRKIKYNGYTLQARWKGYDQGDDTIEPLHIATRHHKKQVLSYIMMPENKELLMHIKENKYGLFPKNHLQTIKDQCEK